MSEWGKWFFAFLTGIEECLTEQIVCEWKAKRTIITSWKQQMEKNSFIHSEFNNKKPPFYRGSFLPFILPQQLSSSWWFRSKCVYPCTLYRYVPKICRMYFTNNEIIKRQWHNAIIQKCCLSTFLLFSSHSFGKSHTNDNFPSSIRHFSLLRLIL